MKHSTRSMLRRPSRRHRLLILAPLFFGLWLSWGGAETPEMAVGAAEGELRGELAISALASTGLHLLPETVVVAGCSGTSQTHTLSLVNSTGMAGTFTLAYDVSTLNGLLTGPANLILADDATATFEVTLTPDLCLADVEVVGTVTASGNSSSDVTTINSGVVTHELVSVGSSAPTWAGAGHPVDGCTAQNAGGEWVTYLIGDTNSTYGTLVGFWGYNHDTNSWFEPSATGIPADRWAPDWAYDPDNNLCYLTGGATTPGVGDHKEAYVFDPVTGTFTTLPELTTTRDFHDSWVATINGTKYLCVGGGINVSGALDSTQCYDLDSTPVAWSGESNTIAAYPTTSWGAADGVNRAAGGDQLWFVAGGQGGQISDLAHYWDDADDQWHAAGSTGYARYRVEGDFFEGRFYQLGGSTGGIEFTGSAAVGWLDGSSWSWEIVPALPNHRMDNVVAVTADSLSVVDGYGSPNTNYVDSWQACADTSTMGWLRGTITDLGRYCANPDATCTPTAVFVDLPASTLLADPATGDYGPIMLPQGAHLATPQASGYPGINPATVMISGCVTTTVDWDIIRPGVEVAASALEVRGVVGFDTAAVLEVFNVGCVAPLIFIMSEPTPLDWVSQAPTSGAISVPELSSRDVDFTFTCSAPGDSSGVIRLEHNDPCTGPLDIQLDLHCLEIEIFADGFETGDTSAWSSTVE